MSKDITIKNRKNLVIGWVKDYGDRKVGMHIRKGFVGHYVKGTDITFDTKGLVYCYGDGVADLVRQADGE